MSATSGQANRAFQDFARATNLRRISEHAPRTVSSQVANKERANSFSSSSWISTCSTG